MRLPEVVAVVLACAAGACSTTQHVGRPPSPVEIAQIEEAAKQGRALVVEYAPIVPLCAGGTCSPVAAHLTYGPINLVLQTISLDLKSGDRETLPLDLVSGLKVTGYGRMRGALIGASVFAGVEAVTLGGLVLVLKGSNSQLGVPGRSQCDAKCAGLWGIVTFQGALLGGLVGAVVGAPLHFRFDGP
jgi:hypothetical protein